MKVVIIGGGICGLALALNLHQRGIRCCVFERVRQIKPLGVGITLLPHAMREMIALGLDSQIIAAGIENRESRFFNRFGQLLYKESRGKFAGYDVPEIGIHRGKLHMILAETVLNRLGPDAIRTNCEVTGIDQHKNGATLHLRETSSQRTHESADADVVVACDGINSAIRKRFYPNERIAFGGINSWRGTTRHKPIFDGRTYMRIGSIRTGKIVIYPIVDNIDEQGNQLINWMADIQQDTYEQNDWNKPGVLADFLPVYENWRFDWLDVGQLIREADQILEYPMVDKDPVETWTFGCVTLAGDAAHPMYPRGSNGAAQALIDARALADALSRHSDVRQALKAYEAERIADTADIVLTNRRRPPDYINTRVEELVGDRPFTDLDAYVSQDELRALSESYKRTAGFTFSDLASTERDKLA